MRLVSVRVKNFRGVVKATLNMDDLTALIGPNGSGKTTLLLAIERFFSGVKGRMAVADFNDCSKPLEITVVVEDGEGTHREVTCKWKCDAKKSVSSSYSEGKSTESRCDKLLPGVDVVYVPAEHETDGDGEDKRNTLWEKMLNIAIRNRVDLDAQKEALLADIREQHGKALEDIERRINTKMSGEDGIGCAPNTEVSMEFSKIEVKPGVDLKVRDLGSPKSVEHKYAGHGTKRAFYMSALQVISEILAEGGKGAGGDGQPDRLTIIAIDEPELHQHPQRQKVLRDALRALSEKETCQVVYTTHSPHFVTLKTPMSVRKVTRKGDGVLIREGTDLAEAQVRGRVVSAMEEAAFANGVVLVEGYTDEVILGAICRQIKHVVRRNGKEVTETVMAALIRNEVAIVECQTRDNIEKFCDVLDSLGIQRFVVWDGDTHHDKRSAIEFTRKRNRDIIGKLGLKRASDFLARVEGSGERDCVVAKSGACFGFTGPGYFAPCFGMRDKNALEGAIKGGEDVGARFDPAEFEKTTFCEEAIPAILDRLAKEGAGGKGSQGRPESAGQPPSARR